MTLFIAQTADEAPKVQTVAERFPAQPASVQFYGPFENEDEAKEFLSDLTLAGGANGTREFLVSGYELFGYVDFE